MKKSLLFASALAICSPLALAVTDGQTYEVVDGYKTTSIWCNSLNNNKAGWDAYPFAGANYARTACIAPVTENGEEVMKVFVGWEALDDAALGTLGRISIINFFNGNLEKNLELTCNGEPITGLLCANQIGCDDFGHVWFAGYIGTWYADGASESKPINIYTLEDYETGACKLQFSLYLPAEEKNASGRLDYYGLVGDVTRQNAACVVTATPTGTGSGDNAQTPPCFVCGWRAEQGSDEFLPLMEDGSYVSTVINDTYPADQASWGTGPMSRPLADDEFLGEYFYVDGNTTCPTLYSTAPMLIESFDSAPDLAPDPSANGVSEFTINGDNFIFYAIDEYGKGCHSRICKLGPNQAFEGMKEMVTIPANGLGEMSDGGSRVYPTFAKIYTDKNNVEGAYVLYFKCRNGISVYSFAPEAWIDPNEGAGVNDIIADDTNNAPVEYFNLNGVAVDADNLTPGVYVTRQGAKTQKVVIK